MNIFQSPQAACDNFDLWYFLDYKPEILGQLDGKIQIIALSVIPTKEKKFFCPLLGSTREKLKPLCEKNSYTYEQTKEILRFLGEKHPIFLEADLFLLLEKQSLTKKLFFQEELRLIQDFLNCRWPARELVKKANSLISQHNYYLDPHDKIHYFNLVAKLGLCGDRETEQQLASFLLDPKKEWSSLETQPILYLSYAIGILIGQRKEASVFFDWLADSIKQGKFKDLTKENRIQIAQDMFLSGHPAWNDLGVDILQESTEASPSRGEEEFCKAFEEKIGTLPPPLGELESRRDFGILGSTVDLKFPTVTYEGKPLVVELDGEPHRFVDGTETGKTKRKTLLLEKGGYSLLRYPTRSAEEIASGVDSLVEILVNLQSSSRDEKNFIESNWTEFRLKKREKKGGIRGRKRV